LGEKEEAYKYFQKTFNVYRALIALYPTLSIQLEVKSILKYLIETAEELGYEKDIKKYRSYLGLKRKTIEVAPNE